MALNMRSSLKAVSARAAKPSRSFVRVQATHRVDLCKKTDIIVSPSILSADFARLGEEVRFQQLSNMDDRCALPFFLCLALCHCAFADSRYRSGWL